MSPASIIGQPSVVIIGKWTKRPWHQRWRLHMGPTAETQSYWSKYGFFSMSNAETFPWHHSFVWYWVLGPGSRSTSDCIYYYSPWCGGGLRASPSYASGLCRDKDLISNFWGLFNQGTQKASPLILSCGCFQGILCSLCPETGRQKISLSWQG